MLLVVVMMAAPSRAAHAEPPRFTIEVEQNQVNVGEGFVVQVSLGVSNDEVTDYRPPEFKGLRVLQAARAPNQSTQMQFGGAGMFVQVTYSWRYEVAATRAGSVSIGPARVKVNGQDFRSSVATISALAAGSAAVNSPPPLANSSPQLAPTTGNSARNTAAPPEATSGGSFIRVVPEKEKLFVGEATGATWFLYMNQPHDKYDTVMEPRMEGFWTEEVTTPSRRGSLVLTQEVVEGRPYQVGAILKKALFPLKPGRLVITAMEADLSRSDFFGMAVSKQHVRSPVTTIEVLPLPSAGQPPGFDLANVGRFSLTARVDRSDVNVGDAITLTIDIAGRGNLRKVALPEIPKLIGWKAYDPRVNTVIDPATGVTGNKSAEILLLPERPGTVQIPTLVLNFFDPETQQYERAEAPGFTLRATGDAAAAAKAFPTATTQAGAAETPATENVLGDDIRPIRATAGLRRDLGSTFLHTTGFGVLVVAPPLLLALALLGLRVRDRLSADTDGRRQRHNRKRVAAHFSAAEAHRRAHNVGPFFAEIERVIREALSHHLGDQPVKGLSAEELRGLLVQGGFAAADAERVVDAMDECDRARFAPGTLKDADPAMSAALERAGTIVAQLRAATRKDGKS